MQLTELEQRVIDLIDGGFTRWKIAEELGLGESTVREVIRRLCERYNCSMRDLPNAVEEQQ